MNISIMIEQAANLGVSDIHLTVGSMPAFRLHGVLYPLDAEEIKDNIDLLDLEEFRPLLPEDTESIARGVMNKQQYQKFKELGEYDFSCNSTHGAIRLRVNVFKQRNTTALVMRLIKNNIPSFRELGLPDILLHLSRKPRGLVLITGPAGCGKSTTLAAIIDFINREKRLHVLTLEDPIEHLYSHNLSLINQREIGKDSKTFASALRAALRENPDVIMIGEMRDLETIAIAVTAAETGHLVLATMHTSGSAETIERIIDVFPADNQKQIRIQLAGAIEGIVSQQLIPRTDRPGLVLAMEVLVATPAIRNLIREGKAYQIASHLQTGAKYGMQTMDMSLRQLYHKKLISREELISRARDPEILLRNPEV